MGKVKVKASWPLTSNRSSRGGPESLMPTSAARVTEGRDVDPRLRSVPESVALDVWCAPQPSWLHRSRSPPTVSSAWGGLGLGLGLGGGLGVG